MGYRQNRAVGKAVAKPPWPTEVVRHEDGLAVTRHKGVDRTEGRGR
jgi:hypothetical protein